MKGDDSIRIRVLRHNHRIATRHVRLPDRSQRADWPTGASRDELLIKTRHRKPVPSALAHTALAERSPKVCAIEPACWTDAVATGVAMRDLVGAIRSTVRDAPL